MGKTWKTAFAMVVWTNNFKQQLKQQYCTMVKKRQNSQNIEVLTKDKISNVSLQNGENKNTIVKPLKRNCGALAKWFENIKNQTGINTFTYLPKGICMAKMYHIKAIKNNN